MRLRWSLAVTLVLGCATHGSPDPSDVFTLVVKDLRGNPVDVAALEGVRVVEFWATWCEPCLRQRPALEAFAQEVEPRGVRVLAVSIDEQLVDLHTQLLQRPTSLEVLWDPAGESSDRYTRIRWGNSIPTTVLVDRNDRVVRRYRGVREDFIPNLERDLAALE